MTAQDNRRRICARATSLFPSQVLRTIAADGVRGRNLATVTIYDVAARAGVSIKSVSRVLNNEPNVSPSLRAKVEEAAGALG